jgi:hypothetical protein
MSGPKRDCFYIDSHNHGLPAPSGVPGLQPKERAIIVGFSWLTRLAADPPKANALVAFDQIQVAENASRVLSLLMPGKTFDQFKKGQTVKVGAVSVTLMTKLKHPPTWDGPVLVIYPSEDLLNVVDAIEGVTDVMVVPWQPLDKDAPVAAWIAKWSGRPIIPQAQPAPKSDEEK